MTDEIRVEIEIYIHDGGVSKVDADSLAIEVEGFAQRKLELALGKPVVCDVDATVIP